MSGRAALAGALVVAAVLLGGCVTMPTSGPVRDAPEPQTGAEGQGSWYDPVGPRPGLSAHDVVLGFLDAMQAAPIRTDVAKEYLSRDGQASWDPQQATLIYGNRPNPVGSSTVTIELKGDRLDRRGTWRGAIPARLSQVGFTMIRQEGEWRIDQAPNALIVPESWFDDWFTQENVYFFDPTGQTLVPQPIYVPTGEQQPTVLLDSLLSGPGPGLDDVVRSFLPADLSLDLSVPVTRGVAEVPLDGDPGTVTEHTRGLMLAQIAWTLRGVEDVSAFRVVIDGEPLTSEDGTTEFSVEDGARYDPLGVTSSTLLYGLVDGVVAAGSLSGTLEPVDGVVGQEPLGWSTIGTDPTGQRVAGVSADGTDVTVAPLHVSEDDPYSVAIDATDLARPTWDLAGRLWLLDRADGRARVWVANGPRARQVRVPGVTGRRVSRFLVSRDGSRLVAVVRADQRDTVVVSRVRYADSGRALGATRATSLVPSGVTPGQVLDIGWDGPASVAVLSVLARGYSQVAAVSVDGSASPDGSRTSTVRGRARRLISSPEADEAVLVTVGQGVVRVGEGGQVLRIEGLDLPTLTYAG